VDINALNWAKDLAIETGDTVLRKLNDRYHLPSSLLHMDHIRRADRIAKPAARAFIEVNVNNHRERSKVG
jgi:hypothetical protein